MIAAAAGFSPAGGRLAVLFGAAALVWLVVEAVQGINRRPEAVKTDRGSLQAIRATYIVGVLLALLAARAFTAAAIRPESLAVWLALIFLLCGVGLRLWSFRTLGRYFTFTVQTSDDQPVITEGPYRIVRHPSYLGALLALTGVGFFFGNWVSAIGLPLVVTIGLVYRIRVEEKALMQTLGDRYRDYASTRKRLIPLVW